MWKHFRTVKSNTHFCYFFPAHVKLHPWGYVMVTNRFTKMPLLCFRMLKTSMKWQGKRFYSVKQPWLRLNVWLNPILNVYWPFFVPLCAIPCSMPLANCRLQTHKEHFQLGGESNREGKELIQLEQVTQLWRVLIIYLFRCATFLCANINLITTCGCQR